MHERLQREGVKTHKERVEELNKYLSRLSEHHDMYVFLSTCQIEPKLTIKQAEDWTGLDRFTMMFATLYRYMYHKTESKLENLKCSIFM